MLDSDFYLDGVSAKSKGIFCGAPISFSAAVPKTKAVQIPGRSGDLMLDEGGFYNREGSTTAYVLPKALGQNITAVEAMSAAAGFLFAEYRGYRRLITAEDSGHYWLAQVKNAAEIAPRLNLLNPFSITFDCQPYRYLTGYDSKVTVAASGDVVNNPTLYNAYPILYITGSTGGYISFPNGGITIVDTISTEIAIDCEAGRAYDPITGANRNYLISSTEFPFFNAGNNAITFSNAVVKYIPRFREI